MAYETMNTDYAKAKILVGSFEFTSDEYNIYSIEIKTGAYDGNSVGIGCAYTSTCTVTMEDIYDLKIGAKIEIFFLIGTSWEYFGKFWINRNPSRNENSMTIEAHGALGQFGNTSFYVPDMFYTNYKDTIGTLMVGITETSEMSQIIFDTDIDVSGFLSREITVPVKEEKFAPSSEKQYANKDGISKKDFLSGLAIMFGGNVSERNGVIHIIPVSQKEKNIIFNTSMCGSDFLFSRETYELDTVILKYLNTRYISYINSELGKTYECQCYSGTERWELEWFGWTGNTKGDIVYSQNVECDWLSYSANKMFDSEIYAYIEGEVIYQTGNFSFIGYNKELYAGNHIIIEDENGNRISFLIGEVSLKWDGGFTTDISCNCSAGESGSFNSSSQSGISSSANMTSATMAYNKISFADITFSNIEDSTISGSKFIDGTITGSKIDNSTITGNLIEENTLTGNLIKDGTITNNLIKDSTLTGSKFQNGTLTGSLFENGTITNTQIKDSTLTGAKIQDATIGFEKVDESFIKNLTANEAYIKNLVANVANIGSLTADDAIIKNIQTVAISADYIKATTAELGYMTADQADLKYADITLGNIDTANIDVANIGMLFNEVGLIDRATIVEGHITGFLDAVEINANSITAGTLVAERILLKGSESGLLYQLNNLGELTSENVNTLDGGILTKRTVTADKLVAKSITANELDAENIFADSAIIKTIFANDVEATGTITGATLYGTYAQIESGTIGPFIITDSGLDYQEELLHFGIRKNAIEIKKGMSREGVQIDLEGITYLTGRHSAYITRNVHDDGWYKDGEIMLEFYRTIDDAGSSSETWITRRGIYTKKISENTSEKEPFAMDVKTLDVSGQINAKNGLASVNDRGYASIASDTEGGRIQVKGSGNVYEIDAAGGTLRFIDVSQGKEIALMNHSAFYAKGEIVVSNSKSIRFGTSTSDYVIKGTETTITIGDKDEGGNSGYIYLQGDTKILTGTLDAPKIKEGGELLSDRYNYYQEGEGSVPGGSGWMGVTATFPKPYLKKPFVMVVQNTATSTENIWIEAVNEKAVSFKVYAPNSAWIYSYRWMAMGIKA